jgi:hypothetical protein
MESGLLGPLEVRVGEGPVALGAPTAACNSSHNHLERLARPHSLGGEGCVDDPAV